MADVVERRMDGDELRRFLAPRDDRIVAEAGGPAPGGDLDASGEATYHAVEGPFRSYRRVVTWEPDAATQATGPTGPGAPPRPAEPVYRYRQEVSYSLAIPVFGVLYRPLITRSLRRPMAATAHPWWLLPDRLSARQSTTVAVMAMFHVVGGMLYAFLTNALTFAAADLGDGSAAQQSRILVATRIGAVLTIVVMASADRIGRRRVAVGSAWTAALLTVASALSPSLLVLTVLQTVSRNLAITAMLAADTLSVEELPAGSRAAAQGLGALSYGLGAGVVVVSLPLADVGPGGWRLVFGVAALALPIIAVASSHLTESGRFLAVSAPRPEAPRRSGGVPRPVLLRRMVVVGALLFLVNLVVAPSSQLQNDYLRAERGFDGARISLLVVLTAAPGFLGILVGGRAADRRGRRGVLAVGLVSLGVFTTLFFSLSGAPMWFAAVAWSVFGTVGVPALGVLAPELFPTARRGAARGTLSAVATAGAVVGLLAAGALADRIGYGSAFALLALAPLSALVLLVGIPEGAGRELEALNEDADLSGGETLGPQRGRRPNA